MNLLTLSNRVMLLKPYPSDVVLIKPKRPCRVTILYFLFQQWFILQSLLIGFQNYRALGFQFQPSGSQLVFLLDYVLGGYPRPLPSASRFEGRRETGYGKKPCVRPVGLSRQTDMTIMGIAGHVSKEMLEHYSHIRLQAKRQAAETLEMALPESPTSRYRTSVSKGELRGFEPATVQTRVQSFFREVLQSSKVLKSIGRGKDLNLRPPGPEFVSRYSIERYRMRWIPCLTPSSAHFRRFRTRL